MTTAVPRAERGVTALANRITESQMSSARFAVFATLRDESVRLLIRIMNLDTQAEQCVSDLWVTGEM